MFYFEDLGLAILNAAFKKHSSALVTLLNFSLPLLLFLPLCIFKLCIEFLSPEFA